MHHVPKEQALVTRLELSEGFDETWTEDAECQLHHSSDVQQFHDKFPDYDGKVGSEGEAGEFPFGGGGGGGNIEAEHRVGKSKFYYTNKELSDLLNPREMGGPYVSTRTLSGPTAT